MKSRSMDAIEHNNCHFGCRSGYSEFHKPVLLWLAGFLGALSLACGETVTGDPFVDEGGTDTADKTAVDTESETVFDTGPDSERDTAGDVMPDFECSPVDPELADKDADLLFVDDAIRQFDLYLPQNAWSNLKENALEETYIKAQACFDGRSLGEIGVRFKGGYGTLLYCFDDDQNLICPKLSIKLKFNEYDDENRFFGLKRLNFHGYTQDQSYMREKLAYDLYREMDIVTPRASWAELRVNDEPQGLFGMVEQVDGRFAEDRFPETPNGNLYKEVWPTFTTDELLRNNLKTNEESGDVAGFEKFAEAVSGADPAAVRETLGAYMDLDYLARYMAVDDAVFNVDGITALYRADDLGLLGNHNFYIYEAAPDNFVLIPWDEDATFAMRQGFGGVPRWDEIQETCAPREARYPAWSGLHRAFGPGCDAVFRALADDKSAYLAAAKQLLDGPFTEEALLSSIDDFEKLLRPAAAADPNGQGGEAFDLSVNRLRERIPRLVKRLEKLSNGESLNTFNIDFDTALHDFEAQDETSLWTGVQLEGGANVDGEVSLVRAEPLDGAQHLKLSFDFGNNFDPWGQWFYMQMPPKGGFKDISLLTGIRFRMRADDLRSVRVDLTSPNESDLWGGVTFGWDVRASTEPKDIALLVEDAAIPNWAADLGDDLADTLAFVSGLRFSPQCAGRDSSGFLPENTRDTGYIEIDNIEFF